jgi:POT family proton-dependent oligopeptide transporter
MTKLSTKNLQGMMMECGFCFCIRTVCCRNYRSQFGYRKGRSTNYDELITYTDGYKQLGLYAVIAGVVLILISPFVKKLMQDVK